MLKNLKILRQLIGRRNMLTSLMHDALDRIPREIYVTPSRCGDCSSDLVTRRSELGLPLWARRNLKPGTDADAICLGCLVIRGTLKN